MNPIQGAKPSGVANAMDPTPSRPQLIVASRNRHKLEEIRSILGPEFSVQLADKSDQAPAVVEDAATFEGNAVKKAETLGRWLSAQGWTPPGPAQAWYVVADDSGLEADALAGAPGVHSARFAALDTVSDAAAAGNTADASNNEKLLRLMASVPEGGRGARFRCVLALVRMDGPGRNEPPLLFEGVCEGRIGFEPKGDDGFGYDPLFFPEGLDRSFAQLGSEVKNRLSHRAKALEALRQALT
jgi:XTP/dITP diphosphohydrolase